MLKNKPEKNLHTGSFLNRLQAFIHLLDPQLIM